MEIIWHVHRQRVKRQKKFYQVSIEQTNADHVISTVCNDSSNATSLSDHDMIACIRKLNYQTAITGNSHLNSITNEIQRQNCLLVKKCLEKQTNSLIFDNYFKMLSHEKSTRNNNALIEIPRVKLEVA